MRKPVKTSHFISDWTKTVSDHLAAGKRRRAKEEVVDDLQRKANSLSKLGAITQSGLSMTAGARNTRTSRPAMLMRGAVTRVDSEVALHRATQLEESLASDTLMAEYYSILSDQMSPDAMLNPEVQRSSEWAPKTSFLVAQITQAPTEPQQASPLDGVSSLVVWDSSPLSSIPDHWYHSGRSCWPFGESDMMVGNPASEIVALGCQPALEAYELLVQTLGVRRQCYEKLHDSVCRTDLLRECADLLTSHASDEDCEAGCTLAHFRPGEVYRSHLLGQSMTSEGSVYVCEQSGRAHHCTMRTCGRLVLSPAIGCWTCAITGRTYKGHFDHEKHNFSRGETTDNSDTADDAGSASCAVDDTIRARPQDDLNLANETAEETRERLKGAVGKLPVRYQPTDDAVMRMATLGRVYATNTTLRDVAKMVEGSSPPGTEHVASSDVFSEATRASLYKHSRFIPEKKRVQKAAEGLEINGVMVYPEPRRRKGSETLSEMIEITTLKLVEMYCYSLQTSFDRTRQAASIRLSELMTYLSARGTGLVDSIVYAGMGDEEFTTLLQRVYVDDPGYRRQSLVKTAARHTLLVTSLRAVMRHLSVEPMSTSRNYKPLRKCDIQPVGLYILSVFETYTPLPEACSALEQYRPPVNWSPLLDREKMETATELQVKGRARLIELCVALRDSLR